MTEQVLERPVTRIDTLIERYVALRDKRDAIKKEHAAQLKPYLDAMELLEAKFAEYMDERGLESLPTPNGTAYTSVLTTATVKDAAMFRQFILDHDAWHLADLRAMPTEVSAYADEHDDVPPGINITRRRRVNVRR